MSDEKNLNTNDDNDHGNTEVTSNEVWPRKLNKVIIGVGIIAFGLIIADRLINAFRANDVPETVAIEREEDELPVDDASQLSQAETVDIELTEAEPDSSDADSSGMATEKAELDMESVFGANLVFVSASEPLYVVTEDDQRFDIGGDIDDETTLAGITDKRLILERSGELLVLTLPDPGVN